MTPPKSDVLRSWLALKTWIKIWLFFLNGVFLAAFAFLPHPAAIWSLVAYFASGPPLIWLAHRQGGLSRILGVAHLVPWTPLVVYLAWLLAADGASAGIDASRDPWLFGYVCLLLGSVVLCLAADAWDVVRWLRGERFLLGSREAVRAGASGPAPGGLSSDRPASRPLDAEASRA